MPAEALQKMSDLVNHHMGQYFTWSTHSLDAINEHSNVRALVG